MENVKFISCEDRNNGGLNIYFRICDELADFLRSITKYGEKELRSLLSEDNIFKYAIATSDDLEDLKQPLIETIEKISNSGDDAYFYNHLITVDGKIRSPGEIHELMHNEFGLADIHEKVDYENEDSKDADLEWCTAHFFISLTNLFFRMPFSFDNVNEENYSKSEMITRSASDVSEFLKAIKSIKKIIVVDDVRKYSSEDIKKLAEESDV